MATLSSSSSRDSRLGNETLMIIVTSMQKGSRLLSIAYVNLGKAAGTTVFKFDWIGTKLQETHFELILNCWTSYESRRGRHTSWVTSSAKLPGVPDAHFERPSTQRNSSDWRRFPHPHW